MLLLVAALLGDKVQTVFQINNQMIGVAEIRVSDDDQHLLSVPLRTFAREYRFVPVGVVGADEKPRSLEPDRPLKAGDQLSMVVALNDLEHLLRRDLPGLPPEPAPST